jgi:hypothetical protein
MKFLALGLLIAAIVAAALPIDDGRRPAPEPRTATPTPTPTPTPETKVRRQRDVPRARCPDDVSGCKTVRGTIIYVERVDPDGDGDLHVVVDAGAITLAGMTAIDVAPELRPRRDPRVGDRVSAAGPVQTGSYGQSQIHALEFHVRS